jgi:two-component system chemotaxis response regulator CheY
MKKKILVVDDSPFILKVMTDILTDLDYDVTTVDNVAAGRDLVSSCDFDLIFTDLHMPHMDGIEFVKQVKAIPGRRFTPIVMLSSEGDVERIAEARRTGISTFLSKPVQEGPLRAILQVVIGKMNCGQPA